MPVLAVPFAIVGAAAGWLSVALLSNPLVDMTLPNKRLSGVVISAIVASLVGLYLQRRCAPLDVEDDGAMPDLRAGLVRTRLVVAVLLGGATAGAAIGAVSAPSAERIGYGLVTGVAGGGLAALAFLPLSALVLRAARRSVRARLGSIVARVDARAIASVLGGALGVMTLLGLAEWPWARSGGDAHPRVALSIALGCGCVVAAVLALDTVALRRLRAVAARAGAMEALEPGGIDETSAEQIDLGLGEDVRARVARGDAYRGRIHALAVLRGDPDEAIRTVRRAVVRGAAAAATLIGVIALHAHASTAAVELDYDAALCRERHVESCIAASLVATLELGESAVAWGYEDAACERGDAASCARSADRAAEANAKELAGRLHQRACKSGRFESCVAADRLALGTGAAPTLESLCGRRSMRVCLRELKERGDEVFTSLHVCYLGYARSCRISANLMKERPIAGVGPLVPVLLERACRAGDGEACCDAAAAYYESSVPDGARARELYLEARRRFFVTPACNRLPTQMLGD